ncbi:MAG TPA: hypothetical protein EYO76_01435 [Flavobacteriaceae bacterium]|nr:hypothetical protein [Flavobacteriaceae bacterium]
MKKLTVLLLASTFALTSCNIDKKGKTELPEVDMDVSVKEGNLPELEVDWADVNVGTKTEMVKIPKVQVIMEEEEVEVPYINVDMPDEDSVERTLFVEAEVVETEYELNIEEIRANNKKLYVIAELNKLNTDLGDEVLRVQDQVQLNAPDLDVKYYIIGDKNERGFNSRYTYKKSMSGLPEAVKEAQVIYNK